jgi:hypothetical protein
MPIADLDTALHSIVATEVAVAIEPIRAVLDRLCGLVGGEPARRGRGRPRRSSAAGAQPAAPVGRRRARRGSKAKKLVSAASKFSVGQKVLYRQGAGEFEAKIVRVDAAKGKVQVERISDGKKVVRPSTKVKVA